MIPTGVCAAFYMQMIHTCMHIIYCYMTWHKMLCSRVGNSALSLLEWWVYVRRLSSYNKSRTCDLSLHSIYGSRNCLPLFIFTFIVTQFSKYSAFLWFFPLLLVSLNYPIFYTVISLASCFLSSFFSSLAHIHVLAIAMKITANYVRVSTWVRKT